MANLAAIGGSQSDAPPPALPGMTTMRFALMSDINGNLWPVVAVLTLAWPALAAAESSLSPAQIQVIEMKTARMNAAEKAIVDAWSDGKKLAEFFCTAKGLDEIKKAEKTANRLILTPSESAERALVLEGNHTLSGQATLRLVGEWRDLSFSCTLDPKRGTATRFTYEWTGK